MEAATEAAAEVEDMLLEAEDLPLIELARKLAALENELKERLNVHEAAIVTILQRVMDILDPPALPAPPDLPKKDIGFHVKESKARYRTRAG